MGEINAATSEQAAGLSQVGQAVAQMDQATQQNAALVEQMAAAASSLKSQAGELVDTVAVFKLDGIASPAAVPSPILTASAARAPAKVPVMPRRTPPTDIAVRPAPHAGPEAIRSPAGAPAAQAAGVAEGWETF
jgi:hypothetical protein